MALTKTQTRLVVAATLALLVAGCCPPPARVATLRAEAYSAGDRLFRGDARWIGGDAAYSVALDAERRLWLFGDSFVALDRSRSRAKSKMVRNSLGVQRGADVRSASMRFVHGGSDAAPSAFFAGRAGRWYWPGPAARLSAQTLLVLLFELRSSGSGAFGFRAVASEARLISPTSSDDARTWSSARAELPKNSWGVLLGTGALLVEAGHVYNYAVVEPGDHDVYLARWSLDAALRGQLGDPAWWDGARFVAQSALGSSGRRPRAVAVAGQTELSVHRDATSGDYVMVQTVGFGASRVGVRRAAQRTGPFGPAVSVFEPAESARGGDVLVYAAKAHAELLTPDGAVLLTYASNSTNFATLVADQTLYYPRFVVLRRR